jgi:glycosyltransferase involved in cell wall biosynthesis
VLKVLQLIPTLDRSGAEKQMVLLATGLPRERFEVEVATLTRLGPFEAELNAAGIPVTSIGKQFRFDPVALLRLTRFLRTKAFHIVQTWLFAANVYGRVASRVANVPVVVVAEMAVDVWKGRVNRFVDRCLATWCDRLVGNSNAVVDFYRQLGVPEDRLAMIYSGIGDPDPPPVDSRALRASFGFEEEAPLILFAGRLAEQKRVIDLLKALDLLRHIQPDVCAVIAGDGPLRSRLEESAQAYHLNGRVRFVGHRDDIPQLVAGADLVVLPSAYEGLPNVVLEAMHFRKPVVASRAPGTTEVISDGETGLLVPVGNVPLLARAMRDILRDRAFAHRLGEAGRARVEAEFRADQMIARFAELYEDLARLKGITVG